MTSQKIPVSLYLDTRRAITSGEHKDLFPVKLRVEFSGGPHRQQKYYPAGIYLSEKDFARALSETPGRALRDVSNELISLKATAVEIFKDSPFISPDLFELLLTGKAVRSANVEALFTLQIKRFDAAGKIKSRDSYESAKHSILDFADGARCPKCSMWSNTKRMQNECPHDYKTNIEQSGLLLNNIDEDFLERYEAWMVKEQGNSVTTVGIYLRNLRAVFNDAIDDKKVISRDLYPFGKKRYHIPESNNIKKALSDVDKKKLLGYKPVNDRESEALDYWKVFYYCNGINPIDIAYLQADNLGDDSFTFFRKKTQSTKRVQTEMAVPLRDEVKRIIAARGIHKPYVFGIISPDMDAEKKRRTVENFVKRINDNMEVICKKLGIPRVTTYTARHTVATTLIRKKVPLSTLKDLLGHSIASTTERYVKGIDMEEKKKISKLL